MSEKLGKIRSLWKELAVTGTWIATVAGAFLLPLPNWAVADERESYSKFILFLSTVLAGFVLLLTFRFKSKRLWLYITLVSFTLFLGAFMLYSSLRNSATLPYGETRLVVGTVTKSDFAARLKKLEERRGFPIPRNELLKYVGGDTTLIWTDESIRSNKWKLVFSLLFAYSVLSVFLMGFMNLLLLWKAHDKSEVK